MNGHPRFPIFLGILLFTVPLAGAQETLRSSADLVWPMDSLVLPARATAMGGAFVAASGLDSLDLNPAGLAGMDRPQLALHHHLFLEQTQRGALSYCHPFASIGTLGFSALLVDAGSIESRNEDGDLIDPLRPRRYQASLAWGRTLFGGWNAGAALRGGAQDLDGDLLTGFSADAGLLFRPTSRLTMGASYSNVGPYLRHFIRANAFRAGATWGSDLSPTQRVLLALGLSWEPSGARLLQAGAEDLLFGRVALRVGGQMRLGNDPLEGFHGLTTGLGLVANAFRLDYAFRPWGELGSSHQVSVNWSFKPASAISPTPAVSVVVSPTPDFPLSPTPTMTAMMTPSPTFTLTAVVSSTPNSSLLTPHLSLSPTPTVWIPGTDARDLAPRDNLKLYFRLPEDLSTGPAHATKEEADAILAYQKRIATDPKDHQAWMELGRIYVSQGEREMAIQCLEQALRLRPELKNLDRWLKDYREPPKAPLPP